jgi:hypothetical protein
MFWRNLSFAAGFFMALTALTATAQSGRNIKKLPTPQPTPEPVVSQPTPTPKPVVKPEFKFKIVSFLPLSVYPNSARPENLLRWVVERLESSPLVEIRGNTSGNQKKAKEAAVNSTEEYVIFLQLNQNSFGPPTASSSTSENDLWIDYAVLFPQTGKNKFRDTIYPRRALLSRNRRMCYPTLRDADYMLMEASIEIADNILAKFNLPIPAEKCGRSL